MLATYNKVAIDCNNNKFFTLTVVGTTQRQLCKDKSVANVRNVKPSFFTEEIMTRCEYYQNKIKLCKECADKTNGFMRTVWKTHLGRLILKLNSLSLKERCEEVK